MDIIKNVYLDSLSHDIVINGSLSFYDKIVHKDRKFAVITGDPFPIHSPLKNVNKDRVNAFLRNGESERERNRVYREFRRMKNEICEQDMKKFAMFPNFFIDFAENYKRDNLDLEFNSLYSSSGLEQFCCGNENFLIRPNIDNNLALYQIDKPEEQITIQWQYPDPILSIQHFNNNGNNFILHSQNTINLVEIKDNFNLNFHLKLNCDIGYLHSAINHLKKSEIAIMDTKYRLKLFDLNSKKTTTKNLDLASKTNFVKFDYLSENMLMLITDKRIKILDTRCGDFQQEININLEICDILLNFTFDKKQKSISNTVYLSSKHNFFIFDTRMNEIEDFVYHNLRSAPCYVDYFKDESSSFVTLFTQSEAEKAIFGKFSPYSLPHHLSSLETTYSKCKSEIRLPVIPHIERRLKCPVTGVQILKNNKDVSIYFANLYGELFRQDVGVDGFPTEKPAERMRDWLLEMEEIYEPTLNVVAVADAEAAFKFKAEFNELDVFENYEKNDLQEFLDDEEFNFENWNTHNFLEVWGTGEENDVKSLMEIENSKSKVEDWIENSKFIINEIEND